MINTAVTGARRCGKIKLSYLYALADLRENLLDWCQFDPEQQALQIGADAGALTGLLARRLSSVTVLDVSKKIWR
ncbi:MAG: hypothetical protein ACLR3S_00915 [Clostridium fessum]